MDHDHHHDHDYDSGHDHSTCGGHDHGGQSNITNVTAESMENFQRVQHQTQELFTSVRYGLSVKVREILTAYPALVNSKDEQGHSCLHWAAKRGDLDTLRVLHSMNADMSIRTSAESGMMPIHWAASDGKILALKFFLDMRQDINCQDLNGCTPVIIAAQHNQISCVIFLMKNNADLTLRDNCGDSVLHWCAYKGNVELMALVAYTNPADIENTDHYGQTPLHLDACGHLQLEFQNPLIFPSRFLK